MAKIMAFWARNRKCTFVVAYSTKVLYKIAPPEALVARLLPWGTVQRDHRSLPELSPGVPPSERFQGKI
jgi:hypothetical protein